MLYVSYELGVKRYALMGPISAEHDATPVPRLDSQGFTAIFLSSCIKETNLLGHLE